MSIVLAIGWSEFYVGLTKFWPFLLCAGCDHGSCWKVGIALEKY